MPSRATAIALTVLALLTASVVPAAATDLGPPETPATRQVMFVGNNWEGTATIIDARTFETLATLDMIPDRDERMAEIVLSPDRLVFFLAVRYAIGEGNDQFTDDMFTSHDGTTVYVSRPSFADVVAIDLRTGDITWRFPMESYRSDHMGISPDGERLYVSDSLANKVHELDAATGEKTGEFPSGDSPHENVFVDDGERILHASIGRVYTPTDRGELGIVRDTSKGDRFFQEVDADTLEVLQRWDVGEELAEAGYEGMSAAVRPMAPHPDGRRVFFQVSFHFGFVEFDRAEGRVLRVADLPLGAAEGVPPELYVLDSAHHGLAMAPDGETLCAAGTMSDYAALVDVETFAHVIAAEGSKPYWSTNGPDGQHCWVSWSGDDEVSVIDYASQTEVARLPVGDHPQRVRAGVVRHDVLGDPGSVLHAGDGGVDRLAGDDRYATAAAVAADTHPEGAPLVFLATGEEPADALAVGPVAGRAAGPVLLTRRDELPAATVAALEALGPVRVVVVGGEVAVSEEVADRVADVTGAAVERVAGPTRYDTAAAVSRTFAAGGAPVVYVTGGASGTDAVAAGPAAGAGSGVVLLVGDELPATVAAELERLGPDRIVVVGDTAAVPTAVEESLAAHAPEVVRLAGPDRAGTAAAVAGELPGAVTAYVAQQDALADALVGSAAAVTDGAPVLLVGRDAIPAATREVLRAMAPDRIVVLGGTAVVGDAVQAELEELGGGG